MENTLYNGDLLLLEKISTTFNLKDYKRYEIVVFESGDKTEPYYIKRVIGLPGETIQLKNGYIYINNRELKDDIYGNDIYNIAGLAKDPIELKENEYFVIGDNRNGSNDSRFFGPINKNDIYGRIVLRFYPFKIFTK